MYIFQSVRVQFALSWQKIIFSTDKFIGHGKINAQLERNWHYLYLPNTFTYPYIYLPKVPVPYLPLPYVPLPSILQKHPYRYLPNTFTYLSNMALG